MNAYHSPSPPQYIEDTERFPGWRGELPRMEVGVGDTVGFGELGQVRNLRPSLL